MRGNEPTDHPKRKLLRVDKSRVGVYLDEDPTAYEYRCNRRLGAISTRDELKVVRSIRR